MAWANEFKNLTSEIANMHTYREEHVNQLKDENQQKMNDWKQERTKMKADLMKNFKAWDKEREKEAADIKAAAQNLLAELEQKDKERAAEVNQLKASTLDFLKAFKKAWSKEMNAGQEQRIQDLTQFKADTGKMIADFKADRDEAALAWKKLVGNMSKGQKAPEEKKAAKKTKAVEEEE